MTTLREAAQQALEAMESADFDPHSSDAVYKAITALKAALAEPVQEPIGYLWPTGRHPEFRFTQQKRDGVDGTPVYTAPLQRLALTEEEIRDLWSWAMTAEAERTATTQQHAFARAIEAKHGIGVDE